MSLNNGQGNKYVEAETAAKYYAACVRVKRDKFGFMGYSLRFLLNPNISSFS